MSISFVALDLRQKESEKVALTRLGAVATGGQKCKAAMKGGLNVVVGSPIVVAEEGCGLVIDVAKAVANRSLRVIDRIGGLYEQGRFSSLAGNHPEVMQAVLAEYPELADQLAAMSGLQVSQQMKEAKGLLEQLAGKAPVTVEAKATEVPAPAASTVVQPAPQPDNACKKIERALLARIETAATKLCDKLEAAESKFYAASKRIEAEIKANTATFAAESALAAKADAAAVAAIVSPSVPAPAGA